MCIFGGSAPEIQQPAAAAPPPAAPPPEQPIGLTRKSEEDAALAGGKQRSLTRVNRSTGVNTGSATSGQGLKM